MSCPCKRTSEVVSIARSGPPGPSALPNQGILNRCKGLCTLRVVQVRIQSCLSTCRYSSAVVEQLTCNQQVPSSTLGGGTTFSFSYSTEMRLVLFRATLGCPLSSIGLIGFSLSNMQALQCAGQKTMFVRLLLGYTQSPFCRQIHRPSPHDQRHSSHL